VIGHAPASAPALRPEGIVARLRHALPQGQTLPDEVFRRRHRALLILLWAHAVGLALFGIAQGYGVVHGIQEGLIVAAFAGTAMLLRSRKRVAAAMVSLGLITSSAVLVHLWGGVIEAHFHFFVMVVVLSLYEDWLPFLLAAAYVVLHHGVTGVIDPGSVYNHADAAANPWKWAGIHGLFVTGAGLGAVANWRLNEDVRAETRDAYRQARESEERFKSAFENAPIGMVLLSIDPGQSGRFLQVNRAMCEMAGRSEEELLARSLQDLVHSDEVERTRMLLERLAESESGALQAENRYVCADGRVVHGLASLSLLRDCSGRPVHGIAQVQDISERKRAQERLAHQAYHDPLTGLPNRRKLMQDLESTVAAATLADPMLLLLFDLDGFKAYNDTFGHPAGDALLARLSRRLWAAVEGRGVAYRMGGDEFCVLGPLGVDGEAPLASAAGAALTEHGEGFSVTASYGSAVLPVDGKDSAEALRCADQRLYGRKGTGRASAARQATDALLRAVSERSADLGTHLHDVTGLCQSVADRLNVSEEELAPLLQAAALHDVGKVGIPDAILEKPGPLDDEEWAFMRTHTQIGERILSAAPALAGAAKIVRSTHEHYDGSGYPDRLSGHDIPLASRIIAVCDAYDAMISDRPYRTAMSVEGACSELRRGAGTQFDPRVVDAFLAALAEEGSAISAERAG
jgi:diguanylate cyclase (GGDEF)-like protein/PAS domain S-box-containing protein